MVIVLLVENSPGDVRLIREMFAEEASSSRFEVVSVSTLQDGIEAVHEQKPAVVLLDLDLPDSQGLDTLRLLRAAHPAVPIVIITGLEDEAVGISSLELGADDYLCNSRLNPGLLTHVVTHAVQRRALTHAIRLRDMPVVSAGDGVIVTDAEGVVQNVNPYVADNLGLPRNAFVGKPVFSIVDDSVALESGFGLAAETGHWRSEMRLRRRDGTLLPVEISANAVKNETGELSHMVLHFSDISSLRPVEEDMLLSEIKYRHLFEIAMEGFWVLDADGYTILVNPRMADMLGYSRGELVGRSMFDSVLPTEEIRAKAILDGCATRASEIHELSLVRRNGSKLVTLLNASPIVDMDDRRTGTLVCVTDISYRKRHEEALRTSTHEELRHRGRASTYFDLLAHDIANLVSPILVSCDLARMEKSSSPELVARFKMISSQASRAASLIKNLRMLEELEQTEIGRVPTVDLVEAYTKAKESITEDDRFPEVEFIADIPDSGTAFVKGGKWTSKVVLHMLRNAVQHSSSEKASVEVTISPFETPSGAPSWRMVVTDDGPGISAEVSNSVLSSLDPGSRFKRGVVTSMSFCAMFVDAFGGVLSIDVAGDAPDANGSVVIMTLPGGEK